ncbi:unnamed protein product [Gongylonema pulchrum]|uniref:Uncharacterized protein n=1 Tax=Gongylonema pulchrum TaxID=637853 RepID=A0A183E660_9BILA|nr:unnamed protein product [Gongylonema pulchrum]
MHERQISHANPRGVHVGPNLLRSHWVMAISAADQQMLALFQHLGQHSGRKAGMAAATFESDRSGIRGNPAAAVDDAVVAAAAMLLLLRLVGGCVCCMYMMCTYMAFPGWMEQNMEQPWRQQQPSPCCCLWRWM